MKLSVATTLLHTPVVEWSRPQSWCDLGCGSGTFTTALAQMLAPGSTIHAVDIDQGPLEEIPNQYGGVAIHKILGDLRSSSLRLPSVNGILMANSLHFIPEQHLFLRRLLSVTNRFLIVEYERSRPNPWDPIQLARETLRALRRGRRGERRKAGNKAIAIWRHDVLSLCRAIQSEAIMSARVSPGCQAAHSAPPDTHDSIDYAAKG